MLKDITVSVISGIICTVVLEAARGKRIAWNRRKRQTSTTHPIPAPHAHFAAPPAAPVERPTQQDESHYVDAELAEEPEVLDVYPIPEEQPVPSAYAGNSPFAPGAAVTTAAATRPAASMAAPQLRRQHFTVRLSWSIGRVMMAVLFGFFGSAFVAGMMEGAGHETIEFGSSMMIVLMILCSGASWVVLSTIGRRRDY